MTKKKILLLVPLTIIAGFLIYTWTTFLLTDISPSWRHYVGLSLFAAIIFMYFKTFSGTIMATSAFLLLGTINLLTLTPSVTSDSYGIRIGSVELWTPTFQLLSFGLLILYCILNFDTIVNIYLDYKEAKELKRKRRL
jgi:hypothetical protein